MRAYVRASRSAIDFQRQAPRLYLTGSIFCPMRHKTTLRVGDHEVAETRWIVRRCLRHHAIPAGQALRRNVAPPGIYVLDKQMHHEIVGVSLPRISGEESLSFRSGDRPYCPMTRRVRTPNPGKLLLKAKSFEGTNALISTVPSSLKATLPLTCAAMYRETHDQRVLIILLMALFGPFAMSQFSFSIAIATPWPTPTHMVASARLPPRFSIPCTAVSASRAPLMPSG